LVVVALNVLLMLGGNWEFVMIDSFHYVNLGLSRADFYYKAFLPTTVLVLLADIITGFRAHRSASS